MLQLRNHGFLLLDVTPHFFQIIKPKGGSVRGIYLFTVPPFLFVIARSGTGSVQWDRIIDPFRRVGLQVKISFTGYYQWFRFFMISLIKKAISGTFAIRNYLKIPSETH
jgi:hypothetical protein